MSSPLSRLTAVVAVAGAAAVATAQVPDVVSAAHQPGGFRVVRDAASFSYAPDDEPGR